MMAELSRLAETSISTSKPSNQPSAWLQLFVPESVSGFNAEVRSVIRKRPVQIAPGVCF
jgi:hypothetical protein